MKQGFRGKTHLYNTKLTLFVIITSYKRVIILLKSGVCDVNGV